MEHVFNLCFVTSVVKSKVFIEEGVKELLSVKSRVFITRKGFLVTVLE